MTALPTIHADLLHALLNSDAPVRPELLAARTGLSRAQLDRELELLGAVGSEFESHPEHGVRLLRSGLGAWSDYLAAYARPPDRRPRRIEIYRKTGSTQELARRMIESLGADADLGIALADDQTTGRGRLGRRWITVPGKSLAFTMAFLGTAQSARITVDRLMFATAVGVARAIDAVAGPAAPPARIKWPNDVLLRQKKVAGVLVETFHHPSAPGNLAAIIGVGINVDLDGQDLDGLDPAVRSNISSLNLESIFTDRLMLLAELLRQMDAALYAIDNEPLIAQWRRRCTHLDQRMTLLHDGRKITGHVVDLDPFEGLIIRTESGSLIHLPAASTTFA